MRRILRILGITVTAVVLAAAPTLAQPAADEAASGDDEQVPLPVLTSENIEYVNYVPLDAPAVAGALREVDGERLFYVWGTKGLSIYNVDQPEWPWLIGHAPLPASQNEDMQVSADGTRAVVAADGGLPMPFPPTTGLHIFDTSDPRDPQLVASFDDGVNHTAHCADDACEWIYGNRGDIYHVPLELDDADDIEIVGDWRDALIGSTSGGHALNRTTHADGTEIMITDTTPRAVMDVTDPENPVELARGQTDDHIVLGTRLQHNNLRPDAHLWEPRDEDDLGPAYDPAPGLQDIAGQLNAGELMISASETNLTGTCPSVPGKMTTWSIANFDRGEAMRPIDTLKPENSPVFEEGNPPANTLGCSAHWFDLMQDPATGAPDGRYLLAAAWYEHGVKVITVDEEDYTLDTVGWAQPAYGSPGAAYWVPAAEGDEDMNMWYIYATDYTRGLHVLRYHADAHHFMPPPPPNPPLP